MRYIAALFLAAFVFTASGCCILFDSFREAAGYPGTELLNTRKDALKETFDVPYSKAFDDVLAKLKEMKATIYIKNKKNHSIVAMGIIRSVDTTEVGIFFIEESPEKTTIEIASASSKAKKTVADEIFSIYKTSIDSIEKKE